MNDTDKTKDQLITELAEMRQRIAALEKSASDQQQVMEEFLEHRETWRKHEFISNTANEFMTLINRSYIYEFANEAYCKAHGKDITEIVNRSLEDVWGREVFNNIIKGYADQCFSGKEVHYENWFEFAGKGTRCYEVTYYPYYNEKKEVTHAVIVSHDITAYKEAEKALRQAEEKYRSIFENAIEGIFRSTPEGRFLDVNPAYARMHGYESAHELIASITDIGRQLFVHPEDRLRFKEILEEQGFIKGNETERLRKDGSKIWVSSNAHVVRDPEGKILYYEGTVEDITARKHLESKLLQAKKLEAIGKLAGGVAHDFNNILTAIIGYANMLRMKMDDGDQSKVYVKQILASSEKAANLTQSLLAFSRKQVIELKPVKINTIINGIEKILQRLLTEDIDIRIALCPEDTTVMADSTQIDQVLLNLVTNARDAMPNGGQIVIETGITTLDGKFMKFHGYGNPGKYLLLSVSDTGVGMDEKTKEKIFEPFFTTKETGKGTGLGLSIVYGIVKQHNGYINVYAEPGKGTTFRIYIPTAKAGMEETECAPSDIRGGTETILLAEDSAEVRGLAKEMLVNAGYTVIEAIDGDDALHKFNGHRDAISLVILDVVMPKRNGKEVYEEIKKARQDIKALFTSGYTKDVVTAKGVHDGSLDFISKPLIPNEFLQKVRAVLDT